VDLVLGDIRPWLNEAKPTPGTRLAVLGGDGRILVPPEQEQDPGDPARARMLEPATLDPVLHPMPFAVQSAKGAERAGLWPQIRIGGQTCLVQRRRLRLQGAPDWELLVAIPEADLLGEPRRVALITLLCSLGAFGVLAWRMVWSSHQIADPLERLAAQTGALVEGHAIVIPATPISELQDLAQTLRAASLALEERKLLEDQLRVAQRREMIGTLAAGVAHDLGNLLSVAGTNLELAQEPDLAEPDRARSLDRAAQALRRSQAFLRALLAVGKPGVVEPRAVDLAALVRESGMMLEPLLGNLVAMRIVCHGEALFVHGDALQLEQVLLNLAVNGRDAMPRGGALTLEAGRDGQGRPYLAVSDEGEGVPPAIRDQLFLPFFTTKGEGKGSGLGLAMVQGIARSHGATVEVASEPGQGSRFTLRFPVADGLPPTAL
jgi:signal transduction histidine kinase